MPITRRDWYIGIAVLVIALLVHALVPRYEWREREGPRLLRIDRWTGRAELGVVSQTTQWQWQQFGR